MSQTLLDMADLFTLRTCPECGYSLEALPAEGVCPECGARYDRKYIVLFGAHRRAQRIGEDLLLVSFGAITAYLLSQTFRLPAERAVGLVPPLVAFGGITAWLLFLRLHKDRAIMVQVWLSPAGYVQRHLSGGRAWTSGHARHLSFFMFIPIMLIGAAPSALRGQVASLLVMAIPTLILMLIFGSFAIVEWRRIVRTNDERVPRLNRWAQSDQITIQRDDEEIATISITCSTYLGNWQAYKWSPVATTVALHETKLALLRQQLEAWRIAAGPAPAAARNK